MRAVSKKPNPENLKCRNLEFQEDLVENGLFSVSESKGLLAGQV